MTIATLKTMIKEHDWDSIDSDDLIVLFNDLRSTLPAITKRMKAAERLMTEGAEMIDQMAGPEDTDAAGPVLAEKMRAWARDE